MDAGIRNPKRHATIAAALLGVSAVAVAVGAAVLIDTGREPGWASAMIGVGGPIALLSALMLVNFIWAIRIAGRLRHGDSAIARWTVPAGQVEDFRTAEAERRKAGWSNDYSLPRRTPPEGLEVIFGADGVLIGDAFFGLSSSGLARFHEVRMLAGNPPAIAFGTAMVVGRTGSAGSRFTTAWGTLRVPVARTASAEAGRVVELYREVLSARRIVKPHFWTVRIRIGLITAAVSAVIGAAGFAFNALKIDLGLAPLIMAVSGTMVGLAGMVLALLAWRFRVQQFRGDAGARAGRRV